MSCPTARSDVERLPEEGILQEGEGAYPKSFFAQEVFDIAFEESPA